ncbi:GNAT family N-acetyltransferase [Candidatus Poribacteria bacterium]|nr:GNAT family N-acetyltransferase [Candidatus Poribacteria bacterium]
MRAGILKLRQEESYKEFINSHPDATIHHTLEWRDVIQTAFGHRPFYIVAYEGKDIVGALPLFEVNAAFDRKRLVSVPYCYFVKVLYKDDKSLLAMLDFAKKIADSRDCMYLEIRHGYDLPEIPDFKRHEHFIRSTVDLSVPIDEVWKKFRKSAKEATKKARRSGLEIIRAKNLQHYRIHYRLALETRKKLGLPAFPYELFKSIYYILHTSGKAKLYMAFFKDQFITAELVLYHNKTATAAIVGSKENREIYRLRPQNLIIWTEIQEAHEMGHKIFDFGVTPPDNEGLLFFKSNWGSQNKTMSYYYFMRKNLEIPIVDTNEPKIQLGCSILRKMPLMVNRVIGPLLLKQFD